MDKINPTLETNLPFSPAAERNKDAILEKLRTFLNGDERILEIGSGTGQHAIHFCTAMPNLIWQPSEVPENRPIIDLVITHTHLENIKNPITLDVCQKEWPDLDIDVVYTANTAHIMSWSIAQEMIVRVAELLKLGSKFIIYGPFNYAGEFTSESNKMFDASLKLSNPLQGIRDFEAIQRLAKQHGLSLLHDFAMPANNRLLVFNKN